MNVTPVSNCHDWRTAGAANLSGRTTEPTLHRSRKQSKTRRRSPQDARLVRTKSDTIGVGAVVNEIARRKISAVEGVEGLGAQNE